VSTHVQALKSFWVGRKMVHKGDVFRIEDEIVAGREELFRLLEDDAPVEAATAAPGEKRSTRRLPQPTAKPDAADDTEE
jgi:hypothetical protein